MRPTLASEEILGDAAPSILGEAHLSILGWILGMANLSVLGDTCEALRRQFYSSSLPVDFEEAGFTEMLSSPYSTITFKS